MGYRRPVRHAAPCREPDRRTIRANICTFQDHPGYWLATQYIDSGLVISIIFALARDLGVIDRVLSDNPIIMRLVWKDQQGERATTMGSMFYIATAFNQNIGSWDVSNVRGMNWIFYNATAFNQNLSGWCVSNFYYDPHRFDDGATSWVLSRPVWGTCPS